VTHTIEEIEEWIGATLPAEYRAFLGDNRGDLVASDLVLLYLESRPATLKNLLMIKELLGINTSIVVLKRSLDAIPCLIADGFTYAAACVRCGKVNAVDPCLGIRLASDSSVRLPAEYTA